MFSPALLVNVPTLPSSWLTAIGNAKVLIAVWSLGLAVYVAVILSWRTRRRDAELHAGADDRPFATVPDDGQTITLYANKSRVALYMLRRTISTGVRTVFYLAVWFDPRFHRGVVDIAISDLLLGAVLLFDAAPLLFAAARFFSDAPILIVNAEGITDNATFMATGMGLVPWREISEIIIYNPRIAASFVPARMLTVVARDKTFVRQQSRCRRALYVFYPSALDVVGIREFLLPMPIQELRAQIEDYARAHGHALRRPLWMPADVAPSTASAD